MIDIVLGTRPEIIKLWSIINELEKNDEEFRLVHTGQHYSETLDNIFFEELKLEEPDVNLEVGSAGELNQISKGISGLSDFWDQDGRPDLVIVQGDTNSTFVGALAGRKKGIEVAHVEAGLRSGNEQMSEEMNRVMIDHISQYLFPPTDRNKENLVSEGISEKKIFQVGNTVVDALQFVKAKVSQGEIRSLAAERGLEEYVVLTCHRAENVDDEEKFQDIMESIVELIEDPIIYPMHPRVKDSISDSFLDRLEEEMEITEPLGYIEFIALLSSAKACITDSGGLQEEAPALNVPCFTIRDETERQESIEAGANILLGTDPSEIERKLSEYYNLDKLKSMSEAENPYGEGDSGKKIVRRLLDESIDG